MPELPEVETVARTLSPLLSGRIITRAISGDYQRCIATPAPELFLAEVTNQRIASVGRRGKLILIRLDSGSTLTVHLRMTGELSITDSDAEQGPHLHLRFELDDGRELRYNDVRKFGRWSLLNPAQFEILDQTIGLEPFDPALDAERFGQMLSSRKRILKPLLLDQTFIAGIGNIYADEALFRAGVHPRRHASDLTALEAELLLQEIRTVLSVSLENRGTTLRDYRDGSGQPGENFSRLVIYSKPEGDPCPVCGTPIVREVIGQRGTKLCPVCQPIASTQE